MQGIQLGHEPVIYDPTNADVKPENRSIQEFWAGYTAGETEEESSRGIKTTLVDRYYSAASTTPKKILGDLIAKAQPHLAKIRKESRGTYEALERQLEEISASLDPATLPTSLTMQQQSLFGLGYYHQRAENRRRAAEGAEKKKQSQTDPQGDLNHD